MMRLLVAVVSLLAINLFTMGEEVDLVDRAAFQAGMKSYLEEDFASAVKHLSAAWNELEDPGADFSDRVLATRLVESLCRNGDSTKAVQWFKAHGGIFADGYTFPNDRSKYWVAKSLLEAGQYKQSRQFFAELSSSVDFDSESKRKYEIYQAHALFRDGAPEAAYRILFPDYAEPKNVGEALFLAGVTFETKRYNISIKLCEQVIAELDSSQHRLHGKAVMLEALCLNESGFKNYATTRLLELVDQSRDIVVVSSAFDLLLGLVSIEDIELVRPFYTKWLADEGFPNRQLLTQFARLMISTSDDVELNRRLTQFIKDYPDHFVAQKAKFELANLDPIAAYEYVNERDGSSSMKELRDYVKNQNAFRHFQSENFRSAQLSFKELADQRRGKNQRLTLFNSAISALLAGEDDKVKAAEERLGLKLNGSSALHADLLYTAGVFYASEANPRGFDYLTRLIQFYPNYVSEVEAKLALAEMHLNQVPSNPQTAHEVLEALLKLKLTAKQKERVDYAQIWVELLTVDSKLLQQKITAFLTGWPKSEFLPEVMMLLATEFYETQQFDQAREKFDEIARDFPESRLRETALFFAAKSTGMYERLSLAIPITSGDGWDSVIDQGGRFANHARHQKAFELLKLDQFEEAIKFLDKVLTSELPVEDELYISAKCDKAFCHYMEALASGSEPQILMRAATAFDEVAKDKRANRAWRYQASVRRGKCLEQVGKLEMALKVYQLVVNDSVDNPLGEVGSNPIEEDIWLYRAGFSAIEILERNKDWKGAVQLAELLAQKSGPRSNEAAQRAERLRLQYFVWDE